MKSSEYNWLAFYKRMINIRRRGFIWLMIILMIVADYVNMTNLFQEMGLADGSSVEWLENFSMLNSLLSDSSLFAVISVLLLEGLPISLGSMLAKIMDTTDHRNIDKAKNVLGFWIGFGCFVATAGVVIYMRWMLFKGSGSYYDWMKITTTAWEELPEVIREVEGEPAVVSGLDFISQIFLLPLPVLTSIWAFVASWDMNATHNLENLKLEVEKLRRNMLKADAEYLKADNKKKDAKWALWCDLALEQSGDPNPKNAMPDNYDTFRYECAKRIRSRHISNCILQYHDESKRYDGHAKQLLAEFQKELSALSTVPDKIMSISIDELIREHDENLAGADCWDYDKSYADHERLLKKLLMNATVIAQYKIADTTIFTDSKE